MRIENILVPIYNKAIIKQNKPTQTQKENTFYMEEKDYGSRKSKCIRNGNSKNHCRA